MRNPNEVYADGSVDVEGNQVSAHLENDSATPTSGLSDRITESSTQPSTGAVSRVLFDPGLSDRITESATQPSTGAVSRVLFDPG